MILMILCYTPISVPHPVIIIREASSGSRGKQMHIFTARAYAERKSQNWMSNTSPQISGNSMEEEAENKNQTAQKRAREQSPLNQLSMVHMRSQRLNHKHMDLHQVLCLYIKAINYLCIFMGDLTMRTSESMTLLPALGTLLFLLACHVLIQYYNFVSFDYILFCHSWLLCLGKLYFSKKRQNRSGSGVEGRKGGTRKSR